ncbi:hypothetical protein ACWDRB_65815 [Nonomuraea sp. NPDC003707]
MKVLTDLLEVTDVCIADLVKETRRVLEDHGHHAGAAQVRFAKPAALLDFLTPRTSFDHRPAVPPGSDRDHPRRTPLAHPTPRRIAGRTGRAPRHQWKLCATEVLTDALGDVCRSSIGNVIRETRPLLQQTGHIPTTTHIRYRTAADLLAAVPDDRDTPTS